MLGATKLQELVEAARFAEHARQAHIDHGTDPRHYQEAEDDLNNLLQRLILLDQHSALMEQRDALSKG